MGAFWHCELSLFLLCSHTVSLSSLLLCFQGSPCRASLFSSHKTLGRDPHWDLAMSHDKGTPLGSHACPYPPGGEPWLHFFDFAYSWEIHSPISDSQSLVRLFAAFRPNPVHLCSCGYLGTLWFQCSSCVDTIYNCIHAVLAAQLILYHFAGGDIVQNYHLEKSNVTISMGTKYQ